MDEFRFEDLEPIAIPVTVRGKSYTLREASSDDACKWRKHLFRAARMEGGKPVMSLDSLSDSEPLLLSYCVWETVPDKNGTLGEKRVDLSTIRSWPNRYVRPLFEKAKEISALDEQEETEEQIIKKIAELNDKLSKLREGKESHLGNLPTTTTDGSG